MPSLPGCPTQRGTVAVPPPDNVAVRPSELVTHASNVESVAADVDTAIRAGDTVRLDAGAYGKLCTIVPPLVDALQSAVVDGMSEAVWSLRDTGLRLRLAASEYQSTDDDNAMSIAQVRPS